MEQAVIRKIKPEDNREVKDVIRAVLIEMGVPKTGTAYEDISLDDMYGTYDFSQKAYFVVEQNGRIIGGAGIAPLDNGAPEICELQKMYFLPEARGKGIGAKMMEKCLSFARNAGFIQVYLETLPYMENARKLYSRSGFRSLSKPVGDTGHYNCTMWMIREI